MPSADRKVIHDALAAIDGVTSRSEGEDPNRRVVVAPAEASIRTLGRPTTPSWSRRSVRRSAWACSVRRPIAEVIEHAMAFVAALAGERRHGGRPRQRRRRARPGDRPRPARPAASCSSTGGRAAPTISRRVVRRLGLDDRVARRQRRCHDPDAWKRRPTPSWPAASVPPRPHAAEQRPGSFAPVGSIVVSEPPDCTAERPLARRATERQHRRVHPSHARCSTWNIAPDFRVSRGT